MNLIGKNSGRQWICWFVFIVFPVINGCVHQPLASDKPADSNERSPYEYYHWLKSLPEIVIKRERKYLEQQPGVLDPDISMVRLAMIITLSADATSGDEKRALDLLDKVINQSDAADDAMVKTYRQFSLLWKDIIQQRRELKLTANGIQQNLAAEQEELQALQDENSELLKQIDALKLIEQQINRREQKLDKTQ